MCFIFMTLFAAECYHQLSLIHESDLIALQSCLQFYTSYLLVYETHYFRDLDNRHHFSR